MRAIMIGGPKNGQLVELRTGDESVMMIDSSRLRAISFRDWDDMSYRYPEALEVPSLRCDVIRMRLGGRTVYGIHHPEISRDTAERYLGDLVANAWEQTLKDRR
ncbi:hypothetical protein O7635_29450 [Asanoa sp. WMMD1127]|uniref:hypothetical protein n=1 Tax=Asanoa sp. WMMD1127 TaxID=3016107 RepID=UPI0024172DB9|nr:hypothetical protein [Asanoa sp. WMMD1127]MDG4825995.1 hypothetical protein [Asanoa sp. WMMD1127]